MKNPTLTLLTAMMLAPLAVMRAADAPANSAAPAGPAIFGDGVHDDTEGIQAALDSGKSVVYLPPPLKHYLISRTLRMHSEQMLRLDRFTLIRLAPKSDCLMVTNDDHAKGNRHIALIGGIWDMDNSRQSPNPLVRPLPAGAAPPKYEADRYLGFCMRFVNVQHFVLRDITFRDPVTFCTQFARLRYFTIDDITFDHHHANPEPGFNMDGIHLDGGCRFGRISNIKGRSNDDIIALNADDHETESPCFGPIEDITIDGIYADDCHSAVRLLSCGSPVRRITISNVHGTYYQYAVGLTKFFLGRPNPGVFDDVTLRDLHCAKAPRYPSYEKEKSRVYPVIFVQQKVEVGRLSIEHFHRREEAWAVPGIEIEKGAKVNTLQINHYATNNQMPDPLGAIVNDGVIGTLISDDVTNNKGEVLVNRGTIQKQVTRTADNQSSR